MTSQKVKRILPLLLVQLGVWVSAAPFAVAQNQPSDQPMFTVPTSAAGTSAGLHSPGKLFGSVERNSGLRIDRSQRLVPQNGYQMDPTDFSQPPMQPAMQPAAQPLEAAAQKEATPKKPTYVWNLSLAGGYYECTGQIKVVVPGDQLYKYGGTFIDGTAVPDAPAVTNFAGHVYRFPYVLKKQPGN